METVFPLVSVIVPVYNAESTLNACVQSIQGQSYPQLEILLVDDGSCDNSPTLLRTMEKEDPRIHVITQKNAGVSMARNAALSKATGRYVQFVDSDDLLPSAATAQLVKAMEKEETDLVIARYHEVLSGNKQLRGFLKEDALLTLPEFLHIFSKSPNRFYFAALWNKLYRRELITSQGLSFQPAYFWGEDFAFNVQYLNGVRKVAILAEPLYEYSRNMQGLSVTTGIHSALHPISSFRMKLSLYEHYRQLFQNQGLYETYRKILPRYLFGITVSG